MPNQRLHIRHREAAPLLAVVLALHVLLLLSLANLRPWPDRGPPAGYRPPLQVWLLDAFKPRPQAAPTAARSPPAAARRPDVTATPAPAGEPQPITLPAAERGPTPPAEAAPAAPDNAAPPPLNLALPRGAAAPWRAINPALDDRSARSARATFEGRFARELGGDGIWVEERIGTDAIRFRRGGTCVDMERGRGEQLDGFNQSFSPKPWVAKQPRPC